MIKQAVLTKYSYLLIDRKIVFQVNIIFQTHLKSTEHHYSVLSTAIYQNLIITYQYSIYEFILNMKRILLKLPCYFSVEGCLTFEVIYFLL